jgi:uncharacterized membrane protein YoaK (UPF0700 family)
MAPGKKPAPENRPTNVRRQRRQENRRQVWLVIFTLFVIGGGLTAVIYGPTALLGVLPVLLIGLGLLALPYLVLKGLEAWLRWYENR